MTNIKNYMVGEDVVTIEQVNTIATSPAFAGSKIRIMPDAHAGKGCVVGTTATFTDKIVPNVVGVDIACRVSLFKLNVTRDEIDLAKFDTTVNETVPCGFAVRAHEAQLSKTFKYEELKCWDVLQNHDRIKKSMGTLGGGNHYISLNEGSDGSVYLCVHTGSRNLGKQVAEYYQKLAIEERNGRNAANELLYHIMIKNCKEHGRTNLIPEVIAARAESRKMLALDDDLCYITGENMDDYLHDMRIINEWSWNNHLVIAMSILADTHYQGYDNYITCIHNYVDVDNGLIRKGAIDASLGKDCIIPLNMRDGVILGKGKGNEDWNCSAPHGAGRVLARGAARRTLSLDDFKKTMRDVYSTCVLEETLDESPMVYKDAAAIKEAIAPTVEITDHLIEFYNFKAH